MNANEILKRRLAIGEEVERMCAGRFRFVLVLEETAEADDLFVAVTSCETREASAELGKKLLRDGIIAMSSREPRGG